MAVTMVLGEFLSPTAIAAEQWVRVKTDKLNNAWYIDKSSIKKQGKDRLFWLYVVNTNPVTINNEVVKSFGAYSAINCNSKMIKPKFLRLMDRDNNVLREYDLSSSKGQPLISNQINEGAIAATKFVCAAKSAD